MALVAVLAAWALFVTSIEAQIFHEHHSAAAEATCVLCRLLHRVAVQGIAVHAVARPRPLARKVVPRSSLCRCAPFFSPHSPRAPPSA